MRKTISILLILTLVSVSQAAGYRLLYKEQLYQLYHRHLYNYKERINQNIYYLEQVQRADFANPLYALEPIENNEQWRRYRDLFDMHISLLLVDQYLQLSSRYTKYNAYFYNYPWKEENIASLTIAREILAAARYYWQEAQTFSSAAWEQRAIENAGKSYWKDQNYRIEAGLLNYAQIIDRHEQRIDNNIRTFQEMDQATY